MLSILPWKIGILMDFHGFFQPTFPMKIWMSDSDGFRMFSSVIDFDTARSFLWNQALPLFTTDWGIWVVSQGPTHSSSNENLLSNKPGNGQIRKIHENPWKHTVISVMILRFFNGPPISDRDFQQWALGWKHSSFGHSKWFKGGHFERDALENVHWL